MLAAPDHVERRSFGLLHFAQTVAEPLDAGLALSCHLRVESGVGTGSGKRLRNGLERWRDELPIVAHHGNIRAGLQRVYYAFANFVAASNRAHTEIVGQNNSIKR